MITALSALSDLDLLAAWREGDARAGKELVARHVERVERFFRTKVDSFADRADLVQATFLSCVENRDRFAGHSTFATYLFGIARNKLLLFYRSRKRYQARFDVGEASAVDLGAGPLTMLIRRREQRLVLEALRNISLEHQITLELVYWESMTHVEVAAVLGINENTARGRIRRAREALREWLKRTAVSPALLESTILNLDDWARGLRDALHLKS